MCEAACLTTPGCALFTFCPPGGAPPDCVAGNGGPIPGTCWFYPIAELPSCSADAGWTSGWTVLPSPTPPPPPPADWAARIAAGQMAYTPSPPEAIGVGWFPVVANGFVGIEMGPFVQPFVNSWPWRDAGMLKLAGVYSGFNYTGPSHRAQIPRVSDVVIPVQPGVTYEARAAAIPRGGGGGAGAAAPPNSSLLVHRTGGRRRR